MRQQSKPLLLAVAFLVCATAQTSWPQTKPKPHKKTAQQAPAANTAQPAASAGTEAAHPEKAAGREAKPEKHEGAGRQLAEKSNEAAGEEGDQFRQSASVKWLARVTGMRPITAYWVFTAMNFLIVAVAIFAIMKSKLPAWFRARTQSIQGSIQEAERASAEARARLSDIEARLARMDAEVNSLRAGAESEGQREEQRIRAAAEEDKRKIIAAAEQEIVALSRMAQRELKAYAAALAVQLAEQRIQIDEETDRRLVRNFAGHFDQEGSR